MKYLVIGAGGTGGAIAGYLKKAGIDAEIIARGRALEEIRKNGLTVKTKKYGDFNVNIDAYSMEEYAGKPDVIIVCVKYYSLLEVKEFLKRTAADETLVIPVLNVFTTGKELSQGLSSTVFDGCIYIYSMIERPGVILQPTEIFRVFFGARQNQHISESIEKKALLAEKELKEANIDARFTNEIEKEALTKFSFVSPMGAAAVYLNARGRDFKKEGQARELFISLINEAALLGKAMGIKLRDDLVEKNLRIMDSMTDDSTTSMQRDILSGGQSEIDGLVHVMARLSRQYGVELKNYEKISKWADEKGIK